MKFKPVSKLLKVTLALVVVCSALFWSVPSLLFWMASPLRVPSDQKLMATFQDHRAAFDELREMATEDSRTGPFDPDLDRELPVSRQQKYNRLRSEIKFGLGMGAGGNDHVVRFTFASGAVHSQIAPEWSKGIEYIPGYYKVYGWELALNLDQLSALPEGMYVREIEPHWFIFYDYMD
jgi:hypothetical protein